jgi:FkbM family methyltransferase
MPFVSYAQNYEDVMLWRALGSIETGFWIDVGAAHPTEYSVTKAFYDRGWRGINIEPEPDYASALRDERPRDINLQVAIAAAPGRQILHRITGTGLSTFDGAIARGHAAAGFPAPQQIELEVTTLAAVCAEHKPVDIHFLKIDVEGAEREVLLGADLKQNRPWIIVVEATVPGSAEPSLDSFADLLCAADYRQCWFDGLNAYFLAAEHEARLAQQFRVPPNIFDDFVRADLVTALERVEVAQARITEAEATFHQVEKALRNALAEKTATAAAHAALVGELQPVVRKLNMETPLLRAEVQKLEAEARGRDALIDRMNAELGALRRSISWRLTAPLRVAAKLLGRE